MDKMIISGKPSQIAGSHMKTIILFPGDYFDIKAVDSAYEQEFEAVTKFPEFMPVIFNYDEYLQGAKLRLYPSIEGQHCGIYRGWMIKPEKYELLYKQLGLKGIPLINSPAQYSNLHLFPLVYDSIKYLTPYAVWFEKAADINWEEINKTFKKFMIKDYVKSVKGTDFPISFQTPVSSVDMNARTQQFIDLRDNLFTGGIVIKEYIALKRYGNCTNEYRVFYLNGSIVTLSKNSNQPNHCRVLPYEIANRFSKLSSNYYTVDFAEVSNEEWVILETGDGQVSGLSPDQYVFKYYDEIRNILK